MVPTTTAPSTQPPDTLPNTPASDTTMLDPAGRGALPATLTTVAIAKGRPVRTHSAAGVRISRMPATLSTARCGPVAGV